MRNENPIEMMISSDAGGYYVEWYQEGVDGSETAMGEPRWARWYGTLAACQLRASKWATASRDKMIEGVFEGGEPSYIFGELVRKGLVHAPGCNREELVSRLVTAWQAEPGYTRADMVNAITRAAHTETWRSPWVTEELEEQAGQLLYNTVHLAPPVSDAMPIAGNRFAGLDVS